MTITLTWHHVPLLFVLVMSVFFLVMAFRPYRASGHYDVGAIFRAFWLFPLMMMWIGYLASILAYDRIWGQP